MKTITLATFDTPAQAERLKRRLAEAHIKASVHGEHGDGVLKQLWFPDRPKAGTKLEVKPRDFGRSLRVMKKLEAEGSTKSRMVRCPECCSSRVEYPQFTRKFFLPNVIGLLSGLGLVEKRYYCEDCHYTWAPRWHKHQAIRAHMAPNYFLEGVPKRNGNKTGRHHSK